MTILFPFQAFENTCDYEYTEEYNAAKQNGFDVVLFDFDLFVKKGELRISKPFINNDCVYRGWMMVEEIYTDFYNKLKQLNVSLINTPEQYISKHHYPQSAPFLSKYSEDYAYFEENTIANIERAVAIVGNKFILKDYVKSEKGTPHLFVIENKTLAEIFDILNEFKEERGKLFNKGFVFKKFVELSDLEIRFFVYKGRIISFDVNSETGLNKFIIAVALDLAKNMIANLPVDLFTTSNFFTIDVAHKMNNTSKKINELKINDILTILETGDGQVSGLALKNNVFSFYNNLKFLIGNGI